MTYWAELIKTNIFTSWLFDVTPKKIVLTNIFFEIYTISNKIEPQNLCDQSFLFR